MKKKGPFSRFYHDCSHTCGWKCSGCFRALVHSFAGGQICVNVSWPYFLSVQELKGESVCILPQKQQQQQQQLLHQKKNQKPNNKNIPANTNNIHRIMFLIVEKGILWHDLAIPLYQPLMSNLNLLFVLKTDICFPLFFFSCSCFIFSDWYNYLQHRFVSGT